MRRLYWYLRVSTSKQDLEIQEQFLSSKKGSDDVVVRVYREVASGFKSNRVELLRMLEDAKSKEADELQVAELSRLGRGIADLYANVKTLADCGIVVRDVQHNLSFDTSSIQGKIMFAIFALLAELEGIFIQERTQRALAAMRERGIKGGRKDIAHRKENRVSVEAVRAMRARGDSINSISKELKASRPAISGLMKREGIA